MFRGGGGWTEGVVDNFEIFVTTPTKAEKREGYAAADSRKGRVTECLAMLHMGRLLSFLVI